MYAKSIFFTTNESHDEIIVTLHNKNIFDVTYQYDGEYENLYPLNEVPSVGVLRGNSSKVVAKFMKVGGKFSLSNYYHWVIGNKNVYHNNKYLYALPFKKGTSKVVTQGFNGVFSHKGESQYAVDFNHKIGEQVYASREGVVVMTKDDGKKGGVQKKYYDKANYITVQHPDGTLGTYNHLAYKGVKVKVGQKIKRGEFIGISGNTGYTNGPHLHFIVYKPKDYKSRVSFPIKFISKEGIVTYPKRGMKLTAK
jgi:murein DD-endopeptidase MepM/ murein hydrolase activator NlpD